MAMRLGQTHAASQTEPDAQAEPDAAPAPNESAQVSGEGAVEDGTWSQVAMLRALSFMAIWLDLNFL